MLFSVELQQMLEKEGVSLCDIENSTFARPWLTDETAEVTPELYSHVGSGSGGYADHIFKYAASELFSVDIATVEYKQLRNPDFKEAVFEQNGKVLLRFAIANGFRNIQNFVQKLKRGKSQYHYVEVMACPSGCLNGGAQVRPKNGQSLKELTNQLEQLYSSLPVSTPESNCIIKQLYDMWLGGQDSDKSSVLLHTQYHAVEKMNTALNIKW